MNKTTKKRVKNTSNSDLTLYGIGVVKAGEEVSVPTDFHNANFADVKKVISKKEDK